MSPSPSSSPPTPHPRVRQARICLPCLSACLSAQKARSWGVGGEGASPGSCAGGWGGHLCRGSSPTLSLLQLFPFLCKFPAVSLLPSSPPALSQLPFLTSPLFLPPGRR